MSTQWQCAVCEGVNDGGDTCSACGALVVQTTTRAAPVPEGPVSGTPVQEDHDTEIPVRHLPVREPASEPMVTDGSDGYEYYTIEELIGADERFARSEGFEARPRVRVYGCCLPIAIGMLLVLVGMVMVAGNLVIGAM